MHIKVGISEKAGHKKLETKKTKTKSVEGFFFFDKTFKSNKKTSSY